MLNNKAFKGKKRISLSEEMRVIFIAMSYLLVSYKGKQREDNYAE